MPRLPFEAEAHGAPDFSRAPRLLPLAALAIGAPAALAVLVGGGAGLPGLVCGAIGVAVGALVTGGFHEDGLADAADGLGGGLTPERRLEIMRDSRIGSYGATALGLSLLIRAAAIGGLVEGAGPAAAAAGVLAAAGLSRAAGLVPLALLPLARVGGAAAAVGRPTLPTLAVAAGGALLLALGLVALAPLTVAGLLLGALGAAAGALTLTRWSHRLVGGSTGDVAGAAQQVGEAAVLIGLLALPAGPG